MTSCSSVVSSPASALNFSARFAAGLRNQFGGHTIQRADAKKIESTGEVKS